MSIPASAADRVHDWPGLIGSVNDAPREYTQAMLGAIVGLEIEITQLQGKFKLSQNRLPADQRGVLEGAAQGAEDERLMAQAMAKVVPGLGGA